LQASATTTLIVNLARKIRGQHKAKKIIKRLIYRHYFEIDAGVSLTGYRGLSIVA
jgi:hypothetical protein